MSKTGFRCGICKTPIRDENHAKSHAVSTKHAEFEEYEMVEGEVPDFKTPQISEEERLQRLEAIEKERDRVQNLIKARKEEKNVAYENEHLSKELVRREQGQENVEIREKMAEEKKKRDLEKAKREREEELAYKQKVLAQVAEDKRQRELAEKKGSQQTETVTEQKVNSPVQPVSKKPEEYEECTLQIKLTNGKALVAKFKPTDTILTVSKYIDANRTDGKGNYVLSTTFPVVSFNTSALLQTTLLEAKLVPRGVLMLVPK